MDEETAEVREGGQARKPKTLLAVGEKHVVKGGSKGYTLKRRADGYYSCSCPAWVNLSLPERERTCGHLKTLLGEEYEIIRIRVARHAAPAVRKLPAGPRTRQSMADAFEASSSQASSSRAKKRHKGEHDADLFPHATLSSQSASSKTRHSETFNERFNGPRHFNGGRTLMLAKKWNEKADPKDFWLSEKLDGVRAFWDGSRMYSRSGRAWNPPQWFRERIPDSLQLDGELWIKRDAFDFTSGICRRIDSDQWHLVSYMVFDAVNLNLPYEERLKILKERLPDGERSPDDVQDNQLGGLVCVLPAVQCTGKEHLESLMDAVLAKGGEGLMLRAPRSLYQGGRSDHLHKYKRWYDAEAVVYGYERGQGRHQGAMGGVKARMESGQTVQIGSGFSDEQRRSWYPKPGMVVRYRFQELSHDGTPRFPIFEGVCADKSGPRDAIVRSAKLRDDARKDSLSRFFEDVDNGRVDVEQNGSDKRAAEIHQAGLSRTLN